MTEASVLSKYLSLYIYVYIHTKLVYVKCVYDVYTFIFCVTEKDSILIKVFTHLSCPQVCSYICMPFNLKRKARLGKIANCVSIW